MLFNWQWEDNTETSEPTSESASFLSYFSPLTAAWLYLTSCVTSAWSWLDGSWLWAPWLALASWWDDSGVLNSSVIPDVEWAKILYWPVESGMSFFASAGDLALSAAESLGAGSVILITSVASFLSAVFAWILASLSSLSASVVALAVIPFQSISWESPPTQYSSTETPVPVAHHSPAPDPQTSLDSLLTDKHLLSALVHSLLKSEEFDRVLAERQTANQQHVDSAFTAALSKIDLELNRAKGELSDKLTIEETSVENKMDALKQQVLDLQMALQAHKALVSEQATLGSVVEAKISNTGQLQSDEQVKLKEQILLEIQRVREEIRAEFVHILSSQKVITSKETTVLGNSELEALVNSTVQRLLAIYDADKIAKVDYALSGSGAYVLNTRCTETYTKKNGEYFIWGLPLWSKAPNDPNIALQPSIHPGECWAFTGSRGYLVIELSDNITVTGFTLEHPHRSLSPTGTIDTAPKDFKVLGLELEQDDTPILLGRFRYEDNGVSLQQFQALEVDHAFKIVELVIESNHGNLEYTCLYRFRVHGRPTRQS